MSDTILIPPRIRSMQVRAVLVLLFIGVVNILDRAALSVANPLVRQEMGLSIAEMGLLLSAFAWAYAFCQLPGGALVDRIGPRRLLGWALIVWSAAQAAVGLVGTMTQFVLARVALGVGEAPTFTSALRVIHEWHHVKHRSIPTALCCSAPATIAPVIAPPLLTWLMLAFGWRWMFVILGGIGIVAAVVWFLGYRDVRAFDMNAEETQYLTDNGEVAGRGRTLNFSDWKRLFGFRATWGLMGGFGGINYLGWLYLAWLPGYLEIERHMSLVKTGIVASIPFVFGFLGTICVGWLSERLIGRGYSPINACRFPLVICMLLAALCTALAAFAGSDVAAVGAICGALFFGHGANGMSWGVATNMAPAKCTASLGGIQNFGGYIGSAMAPMVTGFVVQATGTFTPALLAGAVISLIAAALYLFLIPNRRIVLPDERLGGAPA
jgi:MFS family permease